MLQGATITLFNIKPQPMKDNTQVEATEIFHAIFGNGYLSNDRDLIITAIQEGIDRANMEEFIVAIRQVVAEKKVQEANGMRWVKASERLPLDYKPSELIIVRIDHIRKNGQKVKVPAIFTFNRVEKCFYRFDDGFPYSKDRFKEMEWLEETPNT